MNWEETMKGFWTMVGMVIVNAPQGTDLSEVIENIDKLLNEKVKEEWKE